jgi:hypothetical protein
MGMATMTTSDITSVMAIAKFGCESGMQWSIIALAVVQSAQKSKRHMKRNVRKKPHIHRKMKTHIPTRNKLVLANLSITKIRL